MDEEEKQEKIEEAIEEVEHDVKTPPYDTSEATGYSREYKQYKKSNLNHNQDNWYERVCKFFGNLLHLTAGEDLRNKLNPPLKLLSWDLTPGMVLSGAVGTGFLAVVFWFFLFTANLMTGFLPISIMFLFIFFPLGLAAYMIYKPVFAAKNKVINASGDMILSILYMVVYMRSTPNLEGAVRFAALNLDGPVSDDLKQVLWNLQIGKFDRIEDSLEDYTRAWEDYNQDYLESLQLLRAATNEPSPRRRENMLQDSIDNILDGTQEQMKHYAQGLKLPVMIINALGAMLPVVGMIILPILTLFLGDVVSTLHLVLLFNIMLPLTLYWLMQQILTSRPPTVSFQPSEEGELPPRGRYPINILGNDYWVPVWPLGIVIAVVVGAYGVYGYAEFSQTYPVGEGEVPSDSIFVSGGEVSHIMMLLRSVSITLALGLGIGVTLILGNLKRKSAEAELLKIEEQFPNALFQLGNKTSGGVPVEEALDEASKSVSDMEISQLFDLASKNVREMGMDFEQAFFDKRYGALKKFPSQTIRTIMTAIIEASEKGTKTASMSMTTISRYLKNLHETKETLNDLLNETLTTIKMLAYLLAPIISGVAVGMSQTITAAMQGLVESAQEGFGDTGEGDLPGAPGPGVGGEIMPTETQQIISPEILQLVVGIYLIQLLWILGMFFTKITEGDDPTKRKIFTGKILISGTLFYSVTLLIISLLFGGVMADLAAV